MTPETTDGLSDAELIERLATDVMKWAIWEPDGSEGEDRRKEDVERYRRGEVTDFRLRNQLLRNWNPLASWDDCMEVALRWQHHDSGPLVLQKHDEYGAWIAELDGQRAIAPDPRRAILLAALKCVQD